MLNKSHNQLHGLTLCAIIVLFLNDWPISIPPHIQSSARSPSRAVNFKHRFNNKDQGGFLLVRKGHCITDHILHPIDSCQTSGSRFIPSVFTHHITVGLRMGCVLL